MVLAMVSRLGDDRRRRRIEAEEDVSIRDTRQMTKESLGWSLLINIKWAMDYTFESGPTKICRTIH